MAINRRELLFALGHLSSMISAASLSGCSVALKQADKLSSLSIKPRQWVYGAGKTLTGQYSLCSLNIENGQFYTVPLTNRGHGLCLDRLRHRIMCVDRRPGNQFHCFDTISNSLIAKVTAPKNHHFYGHATYSLDFQHLFLSEQHWPSGEGLVSIYDAYDFRRIGAVASGGIGPHELLACPNGKHLVVANGGIRTRPDLHRKKLNLETMEPNLCYLNPATGHQKTFKFSNHQLSLRHLCINEHGQVAAGFQFQGERSDPQPLIATHQAKQSQLQALSTNATNWLTLNQYTASISWVPSTSIIGATAPRSNLVTFWNSRSATHWVNISAFDAAGIAPIADRTVAVSMGTGELCLYRFENNEMKQTKSYQVPSFAWDNHLAS